MAIFPQTYAAGTAVKHLREAWNLTQAELAEKIGISSKTVPKWETAKGLPDISLLQPLHRRQKNRMMTIPLPSSRKTV